MRWRGLLVVAALGCGGTSSDDGGPPTLRIGGADALTQNLMPALAEQHANTRGNLRFVINHGANTEGYRQLLDGDIDVAAVTRIANPNEQEQAKANGYDLHDKDARTIIGVNVVAVVVHPENPIDNLTYDQIVGIFCTREIDDWSFLGLDPQPINALAREARSGTRALFEDFFCGPRGIHARVEAAEVTALQTALVDDPSTITFVSLSEAMGKPLGLRPDPAGPPIRPSQQNIIRGAYPLYSDLYLVTPGPSEDEAEHFVDYVLSPAGQDVVDEHRFVPLFLRPERMDGARPLRETIHFEPGQTAPNQRSSARLQLLVDELRDRAGEYRHVVLEGYTDNVEPNPQSLSSARAVAVRDRLKAELPGMYFEIIPRGAANPIAPNDTPYGQQRNRRVQIYLAAEEEPVEGSVEVVVPPGG